MTPTRLAVAGAAWLALFALVFSVGSAIGAWPEPPEGFLAGSDLTVGLVFGVGLLLVLLLPRGRSSLG